MNTPTFSFRTFLLSMAMVAGMALITLSPAAAENSPKTRPGTFHHVLEKGTLRVGVALFTPWAFKNVKGQLIGFEIDVAKQLAKDLGVKADIHVFDWEQIIPALLKREIDVIAAGMVITPQRAIKINFSDPYDSSGIGLVTNIPLTKAFRGPQDLNNSKVTITAVTGTVAEDLAQRVFPEAQLKTFPTSQEALEAVVTGKVHGYIEHEPITTFAVIDNAETIDEPLSKPLLETKAAFAVNKGDPDFIHFLNAWIIAHHADTWLSSIHKYWFEGIEWRNDLEKTP